MPLKHSVEEIVLQNGARGLLITVPDATAVHYDIQFRAGNEYVSDVTMSQAAHVMEHMTFGPNERYASLEAFSREFSKNGAYHNAWTSSIDMIYNVDAALMEWDRILDLQLLAITKPRFTEANLQSEKGNVREEIIGYANNHGRILWQTVMRRAGLRRWLDSEELERIDTVTLATINAHHDHTHTTKNMRFIFVGDLQSHRQAIIDQLKAISLPEGELLPIVPETAQATGPVFIQRNDLPSLTFSLQFIVNRRLPREEMRAMRLLNDILVGTMHSRIWGEARTRGICYDMGSWLDGDVSGTTTWGINGQVSPANFAEVVVLLGTQLQKVAHDGVTDEELAAAKEARLGSLQMGTETVRSLASWYGSEYYDVGIIDHVEDMSAMIADITSETIQRLAQEFIAADAWALGGIGKLDEAVFNDQQKKLAKQLNKG